MIDVVNTNNQADTKHMYKAFGFYVVSDIKFPELPRLSEAGGHALASTASQIDRSTNTITIAEADLTSLWMQQSLPTSDFVITNRSVIFRVPKVAIYLVEDGCSIKYTPLQDADEDEMRIFLLGTCMGAILMQRKIVPLHGSAVVINDKAYAFIGHSGAGKSTLAAAFLQRGYKLLSDDVIPVVLNNMGTPEVIPAYPQQKLWLQSVRHFNMSEHTLRPIVKRETKFAIPVMSRFATQRFPLEGVFELTKSNKTAIHIDGINKLNQLHILYYHTYRQFMLQPSGLLQWHFETSTIMTKHIQMYQLQRPIERFSVNDLVTEVLKVANQSKY